MSHTSSVTINTYVQVGEISEIGNEPMASVNRPFRKSIEPQQWEKVTTLTSLPRP